MGQRKKAKQNNNSMATYVSMHKYMNEKLQKKKKKTEKMNWKFTSRIAAINKSGQL